MVRKMIPLLALLTVAAADEININIPPRALALDRGSCCHLVEPMCANACNGRSCSTVCNASCGGPCGPYTCGSLTPETCTGVNNVATPETTTTTVAPVEPVDSPSSSSSSSDLPSDSAYCSLDPNHTMCQHSGPSSSCQSSTIFRELSPSAQQAILDRHNQLRAKVARGEETNGDQPAAANMRKMAWNSELTAISQRWSDQCTFGHDSVRSLADGTYVGQNAFYSASSNQLSQSEVMGQASGAVDAWYNEVANPGFSNSDIKPFKFSHGAGHYTQVVWADSDEIGCGQVYYQDGSWFKSLIICNYAVGGNMNSGAMYVAGTTCSQCPAGMTCDDQGLCV